MDKRALKRGTLESTRQMVVFAMLGSIMFVSKIVMEFLPNVHLLGMLTIVYTLVYRRRALIPIYICVFLNGLYVGFNLWWAPYLYIWTILWGIVMLLPRKMTTKVAVPVYILVCAFHGLLFGTLYAPFQALAFGLSFDQTLAWIAAGFPWDVLHAVGNSVAGILIYPMFRVLDKMERRFKAPETLVKNHQQNLNETKKIDD